MPKGGKEMKELSIKDRIVISCVLFLISGMAEKSSNFYNFRVSEFLEEVKRLANLPKEVEE